MRPDPLTVLRDVFGFEEFRPGQREVIDAVLEGRDCIAVMPTGAGKSLTYQLPARILDGTVLVLSPLISLMKDQVDALQALNFRAVEINSTLGLEELWTPAAFVFNPEDLRALWEFVVEGQWLTASQRPRVDDLPRLWAREWFRMPLQEDATQPRHTVRLTDLGEQLMSHTAEQGTPPV